MLSLVLCLCLGGAEAKQPEPQPDLLIQLILEEAQRLKDLREQTGCPFDLGTYDNVECV